MASARSRAVSRRTPSEAARRSPISASPSASRTSVSVASCIVAATAVLALLRMELVDQPVDRLDDRVERVLVAREHHPAGERPATLAVERVERQVDHLARAADPGVRGARGVADRFADRGREIGGERVLQVGGRAEVVQQVGMRAADSRAATALSVTACGPPSSSSRAPPRARRGGFPRAGGAYVLTLDVS